MNNSDLLKELRIDRSAPPPAPARTGLWIGLGSAAALLVLAVVGWAVFGRDDAVEVKTAQVTALDSAAAAPRCSTRPVTSSPGAWPPCRPRSPARCARC
jgi:hypothetical protein